MEARRRCIEPYIIMGLHGRAATLLGRRRRRGWAATRAFSERRLAVHLQHRHSQLHVPCRSAGAPSDGPSWTATTPPRSSLGAPLLASELDWELRGQTPLVIFADGLAPRGNDAFSIIIITYGRHGRGCRHGCSTVVLKCFTCPAITVGTVILWARSRSLTNEG